MPSAKNSNRKAAVDAAAFTLLDLAINAEAMTGQCCYDTCEIHRTTDADVEFSDHLKEQILTGHFIEGEHQ